LEICLNGWVGELITNNAPKTYMMELKLKKRNFETTNDNSHESTHEN